MLLNLSPELITTYEAEIARGSSPATLKRKRASLTKFFDWAAKEGHLAINPLVKAPQSARIPQAPPIKKEISGFAGKNLLKVGLVAGLAGLTLLLVAKVKLPIHFFPAPAQELTVQPTIDNRQPTTDNQLPITDNRQPITLSPWTIYTKFNLKSVGSEVVSSQTITFKLYNAENEIAPLWTSDPKTVTPDINGDILISLVNVPTELFLENDKLFLGTDLTSAKIPISTANTAANVGGFYPASPTEGAGPLSIPIISADGSLILASESPAIKTKEGNLLIEGQALTLTTPLASDGDITLAPGGSGEINLLANLKIQDANLISGSLINGYVGNNTSNYDLIYLSSGATASEKFSVDALGNTYAAGTLTTFGNLTTKVISATGYSQTGGNFSVIQKGTALNDLVTLTLDERNKPFDRNSIYSTLVLKRYDGAVEGAALYVDEGNAIFDGQLRLGRYSTNPTTIGTGSLVFNSSDNIVYYWNGTSWVSFGAAATVPFSGITSATNTTAAMVVGTGASFTTSGTGTIATAGTGASNFASTGQVTFAGNVDASNGLDVTGNITATGTLAVNGDSITADHDLNLNPAGGQVTFTDAATLNVGGKTGLAYNAFADLADAPAATANITADNDLFIGGDLEIKAGLYLTGRNIYNVIGNVGTEAITLATNPTGPGVAGDYNTLSYGSWLVQNNTNLGMAALMVDQTKGGDIFTASASSSTKFTINNAGSVGIGDSTPDYVLDVAGASGFDSTLTLTGTAANIALGSNYLSGDGGDEGIFVDSTGKVGIGMAAPGAKLEIDAATATSIGLLVKTTDNSATQNGLEFQSSVGNWLWAVNGNSNMYQRDTSNVIYYMQTFNATDTGKPIIYMQKSSSGTLGTLATTDSGEDLGSIVFEGVNAEAPLINATAVQILAEQDAAAGTAYVPGRLKFLTMNSTGNLTNAMTIDSSQDVAITGDLTITGNNITFGNTETINNDVNNTIAITAATTSLSGDLSLTAGNIDIATGYDLNFAGGTLDWIDYNDSVANNMTITTRNDLNIIIDSAINSTDTFNIYSNSTAGTLAFQVTEAGRIYGGSYTSAGTAALCWDNDTGSFINDCSGAPVQDYAELYPVETGVDFGEIVAPGNELVNTDYIQTDTKGNPLPAEKRNIAKLIKTSTPYQSDIIGITSRNWSDFSSTGHGSIEEKDNPMPVALSGRVVTKVSTINGPINIGDPITTSIIPGVGMKASQAGPVVGKAIEPYNNTNPNSIGEIAVFVNISWYDPDIYLTSTGDLNIAKNENGNYIVEKTESTFAKAMVDKVGAFAKIISANIKAGLVETQELVSPVVQTKLISPLPDESDVIIKIGKSATSQEPSSATSEESSGFGQLIIQDATGSAVASIDTKGNATFAGEVHANKIYADNIKSKSLDEIEKLLKQVEQDQKLLTQAANWNTNTATDSASLDQIAVSDLFVTNQAAINSLSVSSSLAIGSDFIIQSSDFSINTLTSPLKLQSLALAPVEIMAGKFKIETNGDIKIQGNVAIAGNLEVSGATKTKELETEKLIIAEAPTSEESSSATSEMKNGEIQTNATAGKATLPGSSIELTINSPHVNDKTLVYVTPTSETKNNVLYVKSKETGKFIVGFSDPIDIDVNFNWWIIEIQ